MVTDWNKLASNLLKSELKKYGITYIQLQKQLADLGIDETLNSINVKINRGAFSFSFFLQCVAAMDIKSLHFNDLFSDRK
jgi:DNA (cytosine-5)-methyltransferase 1